MINKVLDCRCRSDQRHNFRTSRGRAKSFLNEWGDTRKYHVGFGHVASRKQLTGDPHEERFKSEWKHVVAWHQSRLCQQKGLFPKKTCSSFSLRQAPSFLEGKVEAAPMTWMTVTADFYLSIGPSPVSPFCGNITLQEVSVTLWVKQPNWTQLSLLMLTSTL